MAGFSFSQEISSDYRTKKTVVKDTVQLDSISINPSFFKVFTVDGALVDTSLYSINFEKALLVFSRPEAVSADSITIEYLRYPAFLTKKYSLLNPNLIVESPANLDKLYSLEPDKKEVAQLFDGLNTNGSITRGVTVGNNQNAVLNSQLDLQISGQLSNNVLLRASIQDANIPLQESGYSQRLDEFDQIFIELEAPSWRVRAGDVDLINAETYFLPFTKKIQGLSVATTIKHENSSTNVFGAGALVRGNFAQSQFTGQEGNQGPYKLLGPNNELFILIVSGSERVFVNGILLQRGENNDYIIDYNAGEVIFTSKYPITSDMRIVIEYQFTNNSYTRFLGYGGAVHQSKKWKLGAYFYTEGDSKNQPIQETLSEEQVAILRNAGDDRAAMVAPSATEAEFSENRVLYRKEIVNGEEIFVFSNNPDDQLFNVRFTLVGNNLGNYVLRNTIAAGRVFEYVPPINGVPQGNFEPVVQLNAPNRLQLAILNAGYTPSEKTSAYLEGAISNNDVNLFSDIDDADNQGLAARLSIKQNLINKKWKLNFLGSIDHISENFNTIERTYNTEFARDWNILNNNVAGTPNLNQLYGSQTLISGGFNLNNEKNGTASYVFERLVFSDFGNGNKHNFAANLNYKGYSAIVNGSFLSNETNTANSTFSRLNAALIKAFKKSWTGTRLQHENNQQRETATDSLTPVSQRFFEINPFIGVGDSTKVFAEVGYRFRVNDSVRDNLLQRVNTSNTYYINSQLIKTERAQLGAFVSYRNFNFANPLQENEQSLNSRVLYNQQLFKQLLSLNMAYETLSGTLPQQEFTYLEVEPGQGAYAWNDYNNNGIQELDEFELAQFPDEAKYIRVLLPNQVFVKTHQNKFSQTLTFNFSSWSDANGLKKIISHFYNQSSYLIDRRVRRQGSNFNLNPFSTGNESKLLGINQSFRNSLFFNRGKQLYTTSYTFLNTKARNLLSVGFQENTVQAHQLQFTHKLNVLWLTNLDAGTSITQSLSENFPQRNFKIDGYNLLPKLSYLFNQNSRFDVFFELQAKENRSGEQETLNQQRFGASFAIANGQKISLNGEVNYFKNDFVGNPFSPVGYQMLEGLQPGNNFTWSLLGQKRITNYLDLNINYFGRKSETSKTIHTGTVQLRAYF